MYTIKKKFRFEAAHRLISPYVGKCSNLHGHSWIILVECRGPRLGEAGMLRDFASFKNFKKWIELNLDHATLISSHDQVLNKFLENNNQRHYVLEPNPTSEVLAKELYDLLISKFRVTDLFSVEISETCTCSAMYMKCSEE